jgi:hypothetical protein
MKLRRHQMVAVRLARARQVRDKHGRQLIGASLHPHHPDRAHRAVRLIGHDIGLSRRKLDSAYPAVGDAAG